MKKYLFLILGLLLMAGGVKATDHIQFVQDVNIDRPTIEKGYTLVSQDEKFYLGIFPNVLAQRTRVVVKQFDKDFFEFPPGWEPACNVYEFDIFNKKAFKDNDPLIVRIKNLPNNQKEKKLFFYNGIIKEWVLLPSEMLDPNLLQSYIHLPYAKLVVLEKDNTMATGKASWYAYKDCMCAASPDYPKGSILRVKDLDTEKEIQVTVNDYGPDRSVFPDRIIDLDKVAFEKLAPLWVGVVDNILVEKVEDLEKTSEN
ncbi:MAG TPA: septal ring lytic transglycosylase RlpA family protein [Patescibacteria group bacterium]|nr:septal ring lytic transglycosylase RlpA family protein [Patescibacteria group bacterium]